MRTRTRAAWAGLGLLALVAAGCGRGTSAPGGELSTKSPEQLHAYLTQAAQQSESAGPVKFRAYYSTSMDLSCANVPAQGSQEGAYDPSARVVWTGDGQGEDPDTIAAPGKLLVRAPASWHAPTPWVSITPPSGDAWSGSTERSLLTPDLNGFASAGTVDDPGSSVNLLEKLSSIVAQLRDNASQVSEVGADEVHGTPTTHLRLVVDETAPATTAQPDGGSHPPTIFDVWLDADGQVRRLEVSSQNAGAQPGGQQGGIDSMKGIELWDVGVPLDDPTPPDSEVSPFGDLLASDIISSPDLGAGCGPIGTSAADVQACLADQLEGKTVDDLIASPPAAVTLGGMGVASCLLPPNLPALPDPQTSPDAQACLDALFAQDGPLPPGGPPECRAALDQYLQTMSSVVGGS